MKGGIYLDTELTRIEQVFERMMEKKIFVIEGRNSSYHTYTKIYPSTIKTLFRKAYKEFGIQQMNELTTSDLRILLDERLDNYHNKKKFSESYNVHSILTALKAYQKGVMTFEDVYEHWNFIDIEELRAWTNEKQLVRRGAASKTMRATPEQALAVIESLKSTGNNVPNRTMTIDMAIMALATGARISSLYSLRREDIDLENGICHFKKAKGGKNYDASIDQDLLAEVKRIVANKEGKEKIFIWRKRNGQFMAKDKVTDTIQYFLKRATLRMYKLQRTRYKNLDGIITYETITTNFTFHSFRKAYSFKRLVYYLNRFKKYADVKIWQQEVVERRPESIAKLNTLYKRVNKHRTNNKKKWRNIKLEEYATYAASLDIGHERNDIISQYYVDIQEAVNYKEELIITSFGK